MIDECSGTTTTRDRVNRRNTTNTKKPSTTLVLTALSLPRAGPTKTRKTTSGGSSGEPSGRMVTRAASTSPPNKNTLQTIAWARSPRNSCLFVRRGSVGSRRVVRVRQVAAIPAITLRNRRSTAATNTPMTVKPTIKNSTRAAAREPAITDL